MIYQNQPDIDIIFFSINRKLIATGSDYTVIKKTWFKKKKIKRTGDICLQIHAN